MALRIRKRRSHIFFVSLIGISLIFLLAVTSDQHWQPLSYSLNSNNNYFVLPKSSTNKLLISLLNTGVKPPNLDFLWASTTAQNPHWIHNTSTIHVMWNQTDTASNSSLSQTERKKIATDSALVPFRHHVFFLKVHKAASTTVQNILLRFALRYNLTVVMPKRGHHFSEKTPNFSHNVAPQYMQGQGHNDIICCHLVYNETIIKSLLPPDSLYIAIVREPFQQVMSAFEYYTKIYPKTYLKDIPGKHPFLTYIADPEHWEHEFPHLSFTYNRQSFDFGLSPLLYNNKTAITRFISNLQQTFHLVMVSEMFQESLVLLKRIAGWSWKDIVYLNNNVLHTQVHYNLTEVHKLRHRELNAADYALYDRFLNVLKKEVMKRGRDFHEEVEHFRRTIFKVEQFCKQQNASLLHVDTTTWSPEFVVTIEDCLLMSKREIIFVSFIKRQQNATLTFRPS